MYHRAHLIDIYHIQRMLAFSVIICALFKPHQRKLGFCCTLCSINSWVHYIHAERTVGVVCTRTILKWKFRCCCYAATVILNQSAGRLRLLARKWWWTLTVHGSLRGVVVTHCSCKTRKFSSQLRSSRSNWFGKGSIHLHRKLIRKHPQSGESILALSILAFCSHSSSLIPNPTPLAEKGLVTIKSFLCYAPQITWIFFRPRFCGSCKTSSRLHTHSPGKPKLDTHEGVSHSITSAPNKHIPSFLSLFKRNKNSVYNTSRYFSMSTCSHLLASWISEMSGHNN